VIAALVLAAALDTPASPAAYAGQEKREIKALSPEEVESYLAGAGMGFARAAELNHYPGPRHVLDMSAKLGLSGEQRAKVETAFAEMDTEARRLGAAIVEAERALDQRFASADIAATELDRRVGEIAALQGRLRAAHLRAHLATRAALTPDQVARYDTLRGYGHGAGGHHGHH
jgi:Spy/CpxP family protein refolding chaperone